MLRFYGRRRGAPCGHESVAAQAAYEDQGMEVAAYTACQPGVAPRFYPVVAEYYPDILAPGEFACQQSEESIAVLVRMHYSQRVGVAQPVGQRQGSGQVGIAAQG